MPSRWWKTPNGHERRRPRRVKRRASMGQTRRWSVSRWCCSAARADGVLLAAAHRDLSSVFYYYCLGNGAVGAGRHDPDAGAVRNVIKTAARCARAERIFGWFTVPSNRNAERYEKGVAKIFASQRLRWILYLCSSCLAEICLLFASPPPSPQEDRSMFTTSIQLPSALRNSRP